MLFAWDFGDGQGGSGAVVNHTYAAPGTYVAEVTAANSLGTLKATTEVTVVGGDSGAVYLPKYLRWTDVGHVETIDRLYSRFSPIDGRI